MKKILCIISLFVLSLSAFAQLNIPNRLELAQVDVNDGEIQIEVFNMLKDGQSHYVLSVGNVGIGNEIIQINMDPLTELFIPLGDTLDEAMEVLTMIQGMYKEAPGTSMEIDGCLGVSVPNEVNIEPVTLTYRKILLSRMIEFSVRRNDLVRASYIPRADYNGLMTSMKIYRKLHPKEK